MSTAKEHRAEEHRAERLLGRIAARRREGEFELRLAGRSSAIDVWARSKTPRCGVHSTAPLPSRSRIDSSRGAWAALGRPAVLPAPSFALRLVLGEMADELLLASTRAVP